MINRRRTVLTTLHLACVILYLWSLTLPALGFSAAGWNQSGMDVLATGWMGIIVFEPRWYANVAFLYCLLSSAFGIGRRITPLIGSCLVIATLIVPINAFPQDHAVPVTHLGPAVIVWAMALVPVFIASFFTPVPKRPVAIRSPAAQGAPYGNSPSSP